MHVHREVLATAERAADPGQREPHPLGRQAQRARDLALVDVQPLGGDVELDPAVLVGTASPDSGPRKAWSCMPTS